MNKKIFLTVLTLMSFGVHAETLHCGLKEITVENNKIVKIIHEDGTYHTGSSVADNWSFNGTSIKHRLIDESITCGNSPKSHDEIVKELSERFIENPSLHGMNEHEADLMRKYTHNLMLTDKSCHLLVDASKSTSKKDMFFIDCNDEQLNSKRYWVSSSDLEKGTMKTAVKAVTDNEAKEMCNTELKNKIRNSSSYKPNQFQSRIINETGRNVVEVEFKALNEVNIENKFIGKCIFENGKPLEITIN